MGTYQFKHYRRTKPGGMAGEIILQVQIESPSLAQASQIVEREHLPKVDFVHDFALLDGDTGFIVCYFEGRTDA
jgi:hypothetical protein